jgi:hypothetical protein
MDAATSPYSRHPDEFPAALPTKRKSSVQRFQPGAILITTDVLLLLENNSSRDMDRVQQRMRETRHYSLKWSFLFYPHLKTTLSSNYLITLNRLCLQYVMFY